MDLWLEIYFKISGSWNKIKFVIYNSTYGQNMRNSYFLILTYSFLGFKDILKTGDISTKFCNRLRTYLILKALKIQHSTSFRSSFISDYAHNTDGNNTIIFSQRSSLAIQYVVNHS